VTPNTFIKSTYRYYLSLDTYIPYIIAKKQHAALTLCCLYSNSKIRLQKSDNHRNSFMIIRKCEKNIQNSIIRLRLLTETHLPKKCREVHVMVYTERERQVYGGVSPSLVRQALENTQLRGFLSGTLASILSYRPFRSVL